MKISTIRDLLEADVLCCEDCLDSDVYSACGSDMMSDVLAYVKDQAVLLTGLMNCQVVRTAEMMDMVCIVFVRSKRPTEAMVSMAEDSGIVVMATSKRMYEACGILYANGLIGRPPMSESIVFHFDVDGENFTSAGQASTQVKKNLRQLGLSTAVIRRVSIAMYEGEINMVIHANGGTADVMVTEEYVEIVLADRGPGIPNVEQAMQEGFSTATDSIRSLGFGAGMGLPNMKRYTDSMKIDTVIGEGTTITMRVNLA